MTLYRAEIAELQSAVLKVLSLARNAYQRRESLHAYLGALKRRRRRAAPFSVLQQGRGAVDQIAEPILHGLPQTFVLSLQLLAHLLHLSGDQALQELHAAAQGRAHVSHLLGGGQGLGAEGEGHQTLVARHVMGQEVLPLFLRRRRRVVISYYRKSGSLEED